MPRVILTSSRHERPRRIIKLRRPPRTLANWRPTGRRLWSPPLMNEIPMRKLCVWVCGNGENGELGLGAAVHEGKRPELAEVPRYNHNLDPDNVGVTQIDVGGMHCAAVTQDGKVLTWGVNDSKALGRDTTWTPPEDDDDDDDAPGLNPLESTPTVAPGLTDVDSQVVQVAVCDNATFVLSGNGKVYGCGTFFGDSGAYGFSKEQIEGIESPSAEDLFQTVPVQIAGLPPITELATGANHVLARSLKQDVYSWGSGQHSELGRRISPRRRTEALVPKRVPLPKGNILSVFAGSSHNFALDRDGKVWSWGLNNFGQTGLPANEADPYVTMPTVVEELGAYSFAHISCGLHHTIGCTWKEQVLAWGRCDDNQLGMDLDTLPDESKVLDSSGRPRIVTPTQIPNLQATHVAAGIDNTFAIVDRPGFYTINKALAWGFSDSFRTGLGTEDSVPRPTQVQSADFAGWDIMFAYCGGQFSVLAGDLKRSPPRLDDSSD